ncbi:MAG: BTAD domain-containing putative transcriptional regulator [Gemmatimonadota bacterium]
MRPTASAHLRLVTLGSLSLEREGGKEVASILTQPKRLALLAYLTCANPRGLHQRDRVLGMFWPELDQERARAALSQSLYVLKKALGPDVIVTRGADQVGVDHTVVWCDATAFEEALERGNVDAALGLYRGGLLAGFFLSDASGFEDWLERERRRLSGLAESAAWEVAARRESAGDSRAAIVAARRAFELSTHDESSMRRLLALLDRMGDRAGALDEYDRYAKKLRIQFDADPAPETQALITAIRARAAHRELAPLDPVPVAASDGVTAHQAPASLEVPPAAPTPAPPGAAPRTRWPRYAMAGGVALAGALAILAFWPRSSASDFSGSRIAVLPFTHIGAAETRYLSQGVVDLLATKLDGAGELQAVDPRAMHTRVGSDSTLSSSPERAKAIAREFRAGYYLLGNVTQAGRSIHLRATLYDHDGRTQGRAESTAEDESALFRAVDDLARVLLSELNRGSNRRLEQVAGLTTHSVPALKFYLEGDRELRGGRFSAAAQNFQEAIREDTTFALAYYRMALVLDQIGGDSLQQVMLASAVRHSGRLSEHDRRLVEALAQFHRGSLDVAEGQYAHIVAQFPHDTEAWRQLGELVFHTAPVRGRSMLEAWHPFERLVELDPEDVSGLTHFARLAALRGDLPRLRDIHRRVARLEPGLAREAEVRLLLAYREAPRARAAQVMDTLARAFSAEDLWNWAARVATFTENPQALLDASAILARTEQPTAARAVSHVLRAQAFATLGRWRNARTEIARLQRLDPITGSLLGGYLAVLPFAAGDASHLEAARADLMRGFPVSASRTMVMGDLEVIPHKAMRHALLGLVELRLGKRGAAARHADSIDALSVHPAHRTGQAAVVLRAALASANDQRAAALGTIEEFRREHNQRGSYWGFPAFNNALERHLRAELLLQAGREQEAFGWFASVNQDLMFNYFFLAPSHLRRGEILDRRGKRAEAKLHYEKYLALRQGADPELQGEIRRVEERMR